MARRKTNDFDFEPLPLQPPGKTLEDREEQLIAMTMDVVERRISEDRASSPELVHFLKLGSIQAQLQNDKLRHENEVLQTRVKEMESRTSSEGMYEQALQAFRGYAGIDPIADEDDDGYPDVY